VHRAVLAHRQWFLDTVTELLARVGESDGDGDGDGDGDSNTDVTADAAGRHLVMLRDGAMAAGCLFDPELVSETFLHGVEGVLREVSEKNSGRPSRRVENARPAPSQG
jgi:hypothetical protein